MTTPKKLDALLTRREAAAALAEAGYPIREATLATKACRGGGPPFRRFMQRPLYRLGDLLAWAETQCGPRISSTSEEDVIDAADASTEQASGRDLTTHRWVLDMSEVVKSGQMRARRR